MGKKTTIPKPKHEWTLLSEGRLMLKRTTIHEIGEGYSSSSSTAFYTISEIKDALKRSADLPADLLLIFQEARSLIQKANKDLWREA